MGPLEAHVGIRWEELVWSPAAWLHDHCLTLMTFLRNELYDLKLYSRLLFVLFLGLLMKSLLVPWAPCRVPKLLCWMSLAGYIHMGSTTYLMSYDSGLRRRGGGKRICLYEHTRFMVMNTTVSFRYAD